MSGQTINYYLHFHMRGELKKLALKNLRQYGKKQKASNSDEEIGKFRDIPLIDERPPEINARTVPGRWQGDLILGKDHESALCVILERQTRYIQLDLLRSYDAITVRKTIERRFKVIEPQLHQSISLGREMVTEEHIESSEDLKIDVYFCPPNLPWESGTCENTTWLIRNMLSEVEDYRTLNQYQVERVARLLNERPRKALKFLTPEEALAKLR